MKKEIFCLVEENLQKCKKMVEIEESFLKKKSFKTINLIAIIASISTCSAQSVKMMSSHALRFPSPQPNGPTPLTLTKMMALSSVGPSTFHKIGPLTNSTSNTILRSYSAVASPELLRRRRHVAHDRLRAGGFLGPPRVPFLRRRRAAGPL